jgi:argininosuccinate lyase
VLNENFDAAKAQFLSPLMAIHFAHLVMLVEGGIVPADDARVIREGLERISPDEVKRAKYDGTCEDLFFYIERLLVNHCGEEAAGRLHTARSRNDIDMTMYRMQQRQMILGLIEAALELRDTLLMLAAKRSSPRIRTPSPRSRRRSRIICWL